MPFDGVVTKCVVEELNQKLLGGRVDKIFQPERDEIHISIRSLGKNQKLLLTANASFPRIHLTNTTKENPSTPPVFCMLLRKHLTGGKIVGIDFHDFERIITFRIESIDELKDISEKKLIIEIMGRHSNIILTNSADKVIDSIKHVDNEVSSVREIMPARTYTLPPSQDKISPADIDLDKFILNMNLNENITPQQYLLNNIKGFSPILCKELCFLSGIEKNVRITDVSNEQTYILKTNLKKILDKIRCSEYKPCIIEDLLNGKLIDYHCLDITEHGKTKFFDSISMVIDEYYLEKDRFERLKQRTADIMKVLKNSLDRCSKKIKIHTKTLSDVENRENLKLFGELLTANIYCIENGVNKVSLLNYYSENNSFVDIPLDENLTPQQNAQRYYKKYTKAKSAFHTVTEQLKQAIAEMEYIESVIHLLGNCNSLQEIEDIRQELIEQGYIVNKKYSNSKKKAQASLPLEFTSSDGFQILVGKNNKQNDYLTLKAAYSNDIWFHSKNIPGSHVIIKKMGKEIPDSTLVEAAILAAYHSKSKFSANVPVDYTEVKNVKKPNGAKPGMVIYVNYKTINVTPEKEIVDKLAT